MNELLNKYNKAIENIKLPEDERVIEHMDRSES
jgi:hypothetical protein